MKEILDIPKIYTAHAEWLVIVAVILVYRRYITKSWKNLLLILLELGAAYGLIRLLQLYCERHSDVSWILAMIGAMLVIICTVKIAVGLRWSTAFYVGARAFMWAELAASLEWQVYHYYTFARGTIVSATAGMLISIGAFALLYTIFFIVESRQLPKDTDPGALAVPRPNVVFAWVITGLMFALSNLSYLLRDTPFSGTEIRDIFYIRTLSDIVGVVMGQMFHLHNRDMVRREENAAFQTVLRNQYIQFRESRDNIEMINRKYHDLKHQLQILRETPDEAQRSAYIDEIQAGIRKYEAENKTGNSVLDTVLTSKQSRCLKEDVTMTVVADGTLINRISVMDICTIFGNALDNAIEYEIKVPDPEKRLIHVTVSEKNSFVCILVENYYEGKAIRNGSFPETTKKNKQFHGFGLRSIQYTVEKYGGHLNTGVRDEWFRLEIIIPKE